LVIIFILLLSQYQGLHEEISAEKYLFHNDGSLSADHPLPACLDKLPVKPFFPGSRQGVLRRLPALWLLNGKKRFQNLLLLAEKTGRSKKN
jgi:hypothetical protein